VTGPIRMLLPMFAAEPIAVHFVGRVLPGERKATWNGVAVPGYDEPKGVRFVVPGTAVRAGVNELQLTLPAGTTLERMDFDSMTQWWTTNTDRTEPPRR